MLSLTVYTCHGGVAVFVGDVWGDGAHADAQGTNKYEGVVMLPVFAYGCAWYDVGFQFLAYGLCRFLSLVGYGYDGCSHVSMSMGL